MVQDTVIKTYGINRNIDELGRITIPKEYRDALNVGTGEEVSILMVELAKNGKGIFIKPVEEV